MKSSISVSKSSKGSKNLFLNQDLISSKKSKVPLKNPPRFLGLYKRLLVQQQIKEKKKINQTDDFNFYDYAYNSLCSNQNYSKNKKLRQISRYVGLGETQKVVSKGSENADLEAYFQ